MRHAKSDWSANVDDFDRPLTRRGLKSAKKMGAWLKQEALIPDLVVSSPANRAKQTTLIVCDQLKKNADKVIWDKRIYETDLKDLLKVVSDHGHKANCLLLTGHNPGLDHLVNYLSKDEPQPNRAGKLMTTAAIAILDYGDTGIIGKQNSAKLLQLVRPKEL